MSVYLQPIVRCDQCGEEVRVGVFLGSERDGGEVERFMAQLEAEGWTLTDEKDIGPRCTGNLATAPTEAAPVSGGKAEWG